MRSLTLLLALSLCGCAQSESQPRLLVIGDSFVRVGGFQDSMRAELPGYSIRFDGVGGSWLREQYFRLNGGVIPAGSPSEGLLYRGLNPREGETLLIMDGGLNDRDPLPLVEAIAGSLPGRCPRWFYVEPAYYAKKGYQAGARPYLHQQSAVAAIATKYPAHFIPVNATLRTAAGGSAEDAADVRAGWTPRSLRVDRIHMNEKGVAIMAAVLAKRIRSPAPQPCDKPPARKIAPGPAPSILNRLLSYFR